jgi:hypothetical protein
MAPAPGIPDWCSDGARRIPLARPGRARRCDAALLETGRHGTLRRRVMVPRVMVHPGRASPGMVRRPEGADLRVQHPDRLDTRDDRRVTFPPPPSAGPTRTSGPPAQASELAGPSSNALRIRPALPKAAADLGRRSSFERDGPLASVLLRRRATRRLGGAGGRRHRSGEGRQRSCGNHPRCSSLRRWNGHHLNGWTHSIRSIHRIALRMPLACPFLHGKARPDAPRRRDDQAGGNQQASVEFRRPEQSDTA